MLPQQWGETWLALAVLKLAKNMQFGYDGQKVKKIPIAYGPFCQISQVPI